MAKGKEQILGKRHSRKALRLSKVVPSAPSFRRIARRGGVRRMSSYVIGDARSALRGFLDRTLNRAAAYMESAKRKTITLRDIITSLRSFGTNIYTKGLRTKRRKSKKINKKI